MFPVAAPLCQRPQGSSRDPRSPFNPLPSHHAGSCQAAMRAGRACFLLLFAYANKCKMHPSRVMQLLTPLAYGFPGHGIAAAGSTPSLSQGGLGASFAFQPQPLVRLGIDLRCKHAARRASCHHRCPSPAVWINKNLFWIKVPRVSCARACL